ncbi:hypothetical protein [uncultured Desulfobacter sp.]|uniref:hypothetical protein n=1 Tax=uncultured Desulfobacter sp. TaxID=240139 RepID=UPI002AAAA5F8|nr:hypothetical protein [uncultured Desulfobacter sp.]
MTLGISTTLRNGYLNLIRDAIDAGAAAGKINFYNETRPATGGAVTTLLGTVVCSDPSAPDASGGVLTLNSMTDDDNADNNGVATWARITDSDDNFVLDATVGKSFAQTGTTTNGSAGVTGLTDTSKMDVGMEVSGDGIPDGATIGSIDSSTQVTLSAAATATASSVSLTFKTAGADVLLNDNNISQGGIIRVSAGTITEGNA